MSGVADGGWTAVLPIKPLALAKSRMGASPTARAALALAMAQDVAAAIRACCPLLVVTDDPVVAASVPADRVCPDLPRAGLSAAAQVGLTAAGRWRPAAGIVVLGADLPSLRSGVLAALLAGGEPHPGGWGVVADASGTGTSVLMATPGSSAAPGFEGGSFRRHRDAGAADLTAFAGDGLRRDVDTVADLSAALSLGVGPATAATLARYRQDWALAGLV